MNATELRAAAELITELKAADARGETAEETCQRLYGHKNLDDVSDRIERGIIGMAEHVLNTVHADDDEPPTVERLTALLGEPSWSCESFCDWQGDDIRWTLRAYRNSRFGPPAVFFSARPRIDAEPETMGQLRTLLRMAGIEVPR